jgi:hypothetical protein
VRALHPEKVWLGFFPLPTIGAPLDYSKKRSIGEDLVRILSIATYWIAPKLF